MAKASVQRFADKISKFFAPLVIMISFTTWLAWFVASKIGSYPKSSIASSMDEFELALQFGIFVMVIACPCALGLATPTAVMVGTRIGATQGVLIKGGKALESAHKVDCIVFDNTGALTIGEPTIINTKLMENMILHDFYEIVAATEVKSEHPLAKVVVQYAKSLGEGSLEASRLSEAQDFVSIPGHGVRARVRNQNILVDNIKLMLDSQITISEDAYDILKEVEGMSRTGILVSINGELSGIIAISDPVKPEAQDVVLILKQMKVKSIRIVNLTKLIAIDMA